MKKLILLFFAVIFFAFPLFALAQNLPIKDTSTTVVGTGIQENEPPPGEEPPIPTDCQFNVIFEGNQISPARKQLFYDSLSKVCAYPGFRRMAGTASLRVISGIYKDEHGELREWWGRVNNGVMFLNAFETRNPSGEWEAIIVHEMFHVLAGRYPYNIKEYDHDEYTRLEPRCYKSTSDVIKTYHGDDAKIESYAESGTLYVLKGRGTDGSINNFAEQCSNNSNFWDITLL